MATAVKKRIKRRPSVEQSMAIIQGKEPIVTKENFRSDLMAALNWYNATWEPIDYQRAAMTYIKHMKMKDYQYAVSKASHLEIRSIATIGRLSMRDQYVELDYMERMFARLEELKAKYIPEPVMQVKKDTGEVVPKMSVQDRMLEQARDLAGEVEEAIDNYSNGNRDFDMTSFLKSREVSGPVAKKIGSFYEGLIEELDEAIAGTCPQLNEGYSHMNKRELKKYAEFIKSIVAACNQQSVSAKAARKPRARKPKSPAQITRKMTYLREFAELKLRSISPEKIVGATELWVYNTANRKLIWYKAADSNCLTVSGMSIVNYDLTESEVKTLRKPEDFFKGLTSTGKRAMANAWKTIKAKTSAPRARINDTMIILAAN